MNIITSLICLVISFSILVKAVTNAPDWNLTENPFPIVLRENISFTYQSATKGKVNVLDAYNWFETVDQNSTEFQKFIQDQNEFTQSYLTKSDHLENIRTKINLSAKFDWISPPVPFPTKDGLMYFYDTNTEGVKFGLTYIATQEEILQAVQNNFSTLPGTPFTDSNLVGEKNVIIANWLSPDGKVQAYTVTKYEHWWKNLASVYIRNISSPLIDKTQKSIPGGEGHFPDVVEIGWGRVYWTNDSAGFFYQHEDNHVNGSLSNYQSTIRYHRLGTDVKDDIIVTKPNLDSQGRMYHVLSDDKNYLVIFLTTDNAGHMATYITSLVDQPISSSMKWLAISSDYSSFFDYITNIDTDFYFITDLDAPDQDIVRYTLDFSKAESVNEWKDLQVLFKPQTVIPDKSDANLVEWTQFGTNKVLILYKINDTLENQIFNLQTGELLYKEPFPEPTATWFADQSYAYSNDFFIHVTNLNAPEDLYYFHWDDSKKTLDSKLVYRGKVESVLPDQYHVEQVWITSKDGTQVPVTAMYSKGLIFDGTAPCLLNFYGANKQGASLAYNPRYYAWVQNFNGVLLIAGIRGGDDVGEEKWHLAGEMANKQNSFDDVIAVANFAVDRKMTSAGKIIVDTFDAASSTGAVAVNQAKEGLFGALKVKDGLFDMLRFDHPFDNSMIAEYGNPQDPKAFDWLSAYSPLHHINQSRSYPTILVLPDKDHNETNWQSYKYISQLQFSLSANPNPLLLANFEDDGEDEQYAKMFTITAHALGL